MSKRFGLDPKTDSKDAEMAQRKEKEPCGDTAIKPINPFDRNKFHESRDQDRVVIFENNPIGNSKFPIVVKDWVVYIRITKNTTWYFGIPPIVLTIGSRWISDDKCSIEDSYMDGIDAVMMVVFMFIMILAVLAIFASLYCGH